MWTLSLEWNGARFHAQALTTEAVGSPKLSALPTILRLDIVTNPEIYCLDIQAWIRETNAPVVPLRGIDGIDNWHFCQLVETLKNGHTYALVEWEDQGQTLERLLLAPLNESLVCAAFIDDGIPKRPTHQPSRPIHIRRRQPGRQQAHVKAQRDQQPVSQDDTNVDDTNVDIDQPDDWLPDAGSLAAASSDGFGTHAILLGTGGDTGGSAYATSSPSANLKPWEDPYNEILDLNLGQ